MGTWARGVAVAVVLLALAACGGGGGPRPSAKSAPAPMPVARTEVAGTTWRGEIVVLGGLLKDGTASARADTYRARPNRWQRLPDLPVALHHTSAVALGERVFAIGGYTIDNAQWVESARVFSLGPGEPSWREEPSLPAPRGAHAAAVLGTRIVVAGGVSQGKVAASSVTYEAGAGWRAGPELQRPREHLAATVAGGRVYVIAGRADGINFTDVESWDGSASHWWNEPALVHSRGGIGAATVAGAPCVAGGEETGGTIASIECLRGGEWREVGHLATPRHGLAVAARGAVLHVIGGGGKPGLFVSRVQRSVRPVAGARYPSAKGWSRMAAAISSSATSV